jgi:uncharacterized sulfatase
VWAGSTEGPITGIVSLSPIPRMKTSSPILLASALFYGSLLHGTEVPRKNVLVILSDDQGFCEMGSYMDFATADNLGSHLAEKYRSIKTSTESQAPIEVCFEAARKCMPRVDAIAKEGVRFTNFHAAPTCSPSRAALMSARYPQGFGVYSNDDVIEGGGPGVSRDVPFPVGRFQDAGYSTGMVGKWHLGSEKPGQHPNDRGFDYFFGFDRAQTEKYNSKILYRNREKAPAVGWLADQISGEAVEFVGRAAKDHRPFFLYVAYNEPHGPTPRPPQTYIDHFKSGSDVVDVHFATLYGMDQGIGRIIDELKRNGQLDQTLILYGSDNGLGQGEYHHGFRAGGQNPSVPVPGNGPLRGCKWTPWEGGVRVPFIARLPGGVALSSAALVSSMDVMPTAMDYAGIEIRPEHKLDGRSFLPILRGGSDGDGRRMLFWACDARSPYPDSYLGWRPEFNRFDESRNTTRTMALPRKERFPPGWYVLTSKWKLIGWDEIEPVLFDMAGDPYERTDVSQQHPEIVAQLRGEFDAWIAAQRPPQNYSRKQWEKLLPDSVRKP